MIIYKNYMIDIVILRSILPKLLVVIYLVSGEHTLQEVFHKLKGIEDAFRL